MEKYFGNNTVLTSTLPNLFAYEAMYLMTGEQ